MSNAGVNRSGPGELTPGERALLRVPGAAIPTHAPSKAHTGTPGRSYGGPWSPGSPAGTPTGARRNFQAPTEDGRDVIPRIKVNAGNDSNGNLRRHNHWINAGNDG